MEHDLRVARHDRLGPRSGLLGCLAIRPDSEHERLQAERHGLDPVRTDLRRAALALPGRGQRKVQVRSEAPGVRQLQVDDRRYGDDASLLRQLPNVAQPGQ